jgi:hypothetical protein
MIAPDIAHVTRAPCAFANRAAYGNHPSVSPTVPTGNWISTARSRASYSCEKADIASPFSSTSHTSIPMRT